MPPKPSQSQWVHLIRRAVVQSCLVGLLACTISTAQVQTDITPDGTMGTEVTQTGTIHDITGGTRPGNGQNLFHSFDRFSVGTGDAARFWSDPGVDNIISRVTGGAESMIDGMLQAEANLFLLNPQGIMFGPNSTLNVNGSFHASTADVLRFADGATFSARLNERTTLTVAAPSAFGFLSENPAGITLADSQLEVPDGESLSIVGGDIRIVGDGDPSSGAPTVSAPGGRVSIVSVASSGKVEFDSTSQLPELDVGAFDQLGDIKIVQGSWIDVSGTNGGGKILIRGGHLVINNALVQASTIAEMSGDQVGIDIEVSDEVVLTNGAVIRTRADEAGRHAADIHVVTSDLQMENFSLITSLTSSQGDAGNVAVDVDNATLHSGSQINSFTIGPGNGGAVTVHATNITLEGATPDNRFPSGLFVTSEGKAENTGDAGTILIEANQLTIAGGARINSTTFGPGNGGAVTVRAKEITLDGATSDNFFPSGILAGALGEGDAGTILIEADQLALVGGARISSTTFGPGNGGAVTVHATNITLEGATPDNSFLSGLFANTQGQEDGAGDAGTILVVADQLTLSEGAQISNTNFGSGHGGTIMIMASEMRVAGANTRIDAEALGEGSAGSIRVETDRLMLMEGAQVSSSTRGLGPGGMLTVIAHESIDIIDESGGAFRSGLFSNSGEGEGGEPTGDAGDIVIKAPQLTVDGGRILSRTLGDGNAGNIIIEVDRLELLGGGQIFNGIGNARRGNAQEDDSVLGNPDGEGHGGTLKVTARESIIIAGRDSAGFSSGLFSSAQIGLGDAGNLFISAPRIEMREGGRIETSSIRQSQGRAGLLTIDEVEHLILMEGAQIASLSEGDGQGGDIFIRGDRIQLESSTISSESLGTGDAGNIRIAAQEVDLCDNSAITTTVNQGEAGGGNILIGGMITDHGDIATGVERLSLDGSRITANTDAGDGANIAIGARQVVLDSDSDITANTDAGIGGNVTIAGTVAADGQALTRADAVVLRNSRITAQSQEGKGGRIDIVTEAFLADPASVVDASSQEGGIDGEVNIEAVRTNLSEIVTPLSPHFTQTAALLSDPCASRLQRGIVSSFVARGQASVPATPDGLLPSRLYSRAIDPAEPESEGPREALALNSHVRLSRRPCP